MSFEYSSDDNFFFTSNPEDQEFLRRSIENSCILDSIFGTFCNTEYDLTDPGKYTPNTPQSPNSTSTMSNIIVDSTDLGLNGTIGYKTSIETLENKNVKKKKKRKINIRTAKKRRNRPTHVKCEHKKSPVSRKNYSPEEELAFSPMSDNGSPSNLSPLNKHDLRKLTLINQNEKKPKKGKKGGKGKNGVKNFVGSCLRLFKMFDKKRKEKRIVKKIEDHLRNSVDGS